jgi:hypothetical protein
MPTINIDLPADLAEQVKARALSEWPAALLDYDTLDSATADDVPDEIIARQRTHSVTARHLA